MRFIASILAVVLLVLCVVPCADACVPAQEETGKEVKNSSHQEEHQDLCSPFCHCSCCSTVVITPQPIQAVIPIDIAFDENRYQVYIPTMGIGVYVPIWQPPRA